MSEQRKMRFKVETSEDGWSDIVGPHGYREGPYRYRWEAEEFADRLERGLLDMESGTFGERNDPERI